MKFRTIVNRQGVPAVSFSFDGRACVAHEGQTLAAALLEAGVVALRCGVASVNAPAFAHGAYCLMGACQECTVHVDGLGRQQACMLQVAPGMRVHTG